MCVNLQTITDDDGSSGVLNYPFFALNVNGDSRGYTGTRESRRISVHVSYGPLYFRILLVCFDFPYPRTFFLEVSD